MALPVLGITLGDVCGVGPEIVIKALKHKEIYSLCRPVIIGDKMALKKAAQVLKTEIKIVPPLWERETELVPGVVSLYTVSALTETDLHYGQPTKAAGKAAFDYIKAAVSLALEHNIDGIVTCPVNKAVINDAGIPFTGHTELLAELTQTKRYAMLLAGEKLKVTLLTIHVALKEVPKLISQEKIMDLVDLTTTFFQEKFGVSPRLAVAALNPHAGENGLMGREEIEIIEPAVKAAKEKGYNVEGPFPPDTIFYWAKEGNYDVVICMYHDQGLIPFKLFHFRDGVNVTMGLPIIRTSVDHGTAYDIAGKGLADESSLLAAIKMAAEMAQSRK